MARPCLGVQQSPGNKKLDNVFWVRVLEDPAGGLAKVRSDMVSFLRFLESGTVSPGILRPFRSIATDEKGGV